jgi:hypothetical protein
VSATEATLHSVLGLWTTGQATASQGSVLEGRLQGELNTLGAWEHDNCH